MDRKQKEKEFIVHHDKTFENLKIDNPFFVLKTAFYEKGKFGRNIQLYESELKKNEDIYIEFIDVVRSESGVEQDYSPMLEDRPLFKFNANSFYAEEYEIRNKLDYSVYIISVNELMVVMPDGSSISYSLYEKRKEEDKKKKDSLPKLQNTLSLFPDFEKEFPSKGSDFDLDKENDLSFADITIKDFAAIMWKKPVSDKKWLNDLINNI
jgi:hypothetical protein